jgi:hypothetical protein
MEKKGYTIKYLRPALLIYGIGYWFSRFVTHFFNGVKIQEGVFGAYDVIIYNINAYPVIPLMCALMGVYLTFSRKGVSFNFGSK